MSMTGICNIGFYIAKFGPKRVLGPVDAGYFWKLFWGRLITHINLIDFTSPDKAERSMLLFLSLHGLVYLGDQFWFFQTL